MYLQKNRVSFNEEPRPRWVHWFFSFEHNWGFIEEKKAQIIGKRSKSEKIAETRQQIAGFLENHSILYNNEYYSVIREE